MQKLKIYFTSDLHGYVYPTDYTNDKFKSMGLLNLANKFIKDDNTLIIDGGDTLQGSPFITYLKNYSYKINPICEIMNTIGYDYITLGNHDFNYGYSNLINYVNNLSAKCLCANVKDTQNLLKVFPYDIKTLKNGIKVGIIGITTDFINIWETPNNLKNFIISDTFKAIKTHFSYVKSQSDITIGLYHGGFEYDLNSHDKLSNTSENIGFKICKEFNFDLLLTGHQHRQIINKSLFGTHIVQTLNNGKKFIEINITFNNKVFKISSSLQAVDGSPHKKLYKKFLPIEHKVQQWLDTPVGHLDIPLISDTHLSMALNGSYLANFINQIQLKISGAHISCASLANSIKGFNKAVTVRDIVSTYVYPNTLVVLEIKGKDLRTVLEKCADYFSYNNGNIQVSSSYLSPKITHYNYDYFSNIYYTFDLTKEIGKRLIDLKFNNKTVLDTDTLTLVMNNYRSTGSGGFDIYTKCRVIKEIPIEMSEIIINYFSMYKDIIVDKNKYLKVLY